MVYDGPLYSLMVACTMYPDYLYQYIMQLHTQKPRFRWELIREVVESPTSVRLRIDMAVI